MKKMMLFWSGHMSRIDNDSLPKAIICVVVKGQGRTGRPGIMWRDNLDYDTESG